VVATGFDEAYYANRTRQMPMSTVAAVDDGTALSRRSLDDTDDDSQPASDTKADDFHADDTPNIWALSDDSNGPADDNQVVGEAAQKNLDEPSFLRRLLRGKPRGDKLEHAMIEDEPEPTSAPEPEPMSDSDKEEPKADKKDQSAAEAESSEDDYAANDEESEKDAKDQDKQAKKSKK